MSTTKLSSRVKDAVSWPWLMPLMLAVFMGVLVVLLVHSASVPQQNSVELHKIERQLDQCVKSHEEMQKQMVTVQSTLDERKQVFDAMKERLSKDGKP